MTTAFKFRVWGEDTNGMTELRQPARVRSELIERRSFRENDLMKFVVDGQRTPEVLIRLAALHANSFRANLSGRHLRLPPPQLTRALVDEVLKSPTASYSPAQRLRIALAALPTRSADAPARRARSLFRR